MKTPRKIAQQKPPAGIVWIEDYTDAADGTVTPGIATRLGITPSTYRKWRMVGKGPHSFLFGRRVAARISTVDAWVAQQERNAMPVAA
ncbi:hypothetical protein OS965_02095 [Streptomyces sp. H27-G5]|uniref:helix-turn-helix transcriptional regulator n=1 Tax=Streptomyces sp. H27-G5 TaxID=2996698 RepID=UPI002271B472|nr:hypothetical protein [Streptomyces sp. H27-G5]MCY0916966.1 hypothetical protein [Streptomyces sp. H27-G5]